MRVVLLHALPLAGAMWQGVADALGMQALAPDLYRLGDTLEEWAAAILHMTGDDPLMVVGNSVGGSCAVEMARLEPTRVQGLVLIGAKAGHRPEPALRDACVRLVQSDGVGAAWEKYWSPLLAPTAPAVVVRKARDLALSQPVADVVRGVRVFHKRADRADWLTAWKRPVTVVNGEYDRPARGEATAADLHQGRFVLLPGVGHYAPLEAPAAIAEVVRTSMAGALDAEERPSVSRWPSWSQ